MLRKDTHKPIRQMKVYMNKVYSPQTNTWFHDLLDNGKHNDGPRYWHVFVGTNTRYMVVYPLGNKNNNAIEESLTFSLIIIIQKD